MYSNQKVHNAFHPVPHTPQHSTSFSCSSSLGYCSSSRSHSRRTHARLREYRSPRMYSNQKVHNAFHPVPHTPQHSTSFSCSSSLGYCSSSLSFSAYSCSSPSLSRVSKPCSSAAWPPGCMRLSETWSIWSVLATGFWPPGGIATLVAA